LNHECQTLQLAQRIIMQTLFVQNGLKLLNIPPQLENITSTEVNSFSIDLVKTLCVQHIFINVEIS